MSPPCSAVSKPSRHGRLAGRESEDADLHERNDEEDITRPLAILFVLAHHRADAGDPLHRFVRFEARSYRQHAGDRSQKDERRRHRSHKRDPSWERDQRHDARGHSDDQKGDDEVNELRMETGYLRHGRDSLDGVGGGLEARLGLILLRGSRSGQCCTMLSHGEDRAVLLALRYLFGML